MKAFIYCCAGAVAALSVPASVLTLPAGADDGVAGLLLGDSESARMLIGRFPPETQPYGFSQYQFTNREHNEILTLVQHPGAEEFDISQVHVNANKAEDSEVALPLFPNGPQHFVTARGIHVGATKQEVRSLLGEPTTETDDLLIYRLTKDSAGSWLELHNMPEYRAVYEFGNGRLVDFEFGFPYP